MVATVMVHPRIMKIYKNLPGDIPNIFPYQHFIFSLRNCSSLKTFNQREILRHFSYVCLSVRPTVRSNHDYVRTQRATDLKICT